MFAGTVETVTHARDGKIRVLGVGTPQRIPELPDSPAIGEVVPGYVATNWYALFGPRGLPDTIVARLQAELLKARDEDGEPMTDQELRDELIDGLVVNQRLVKPACDRLAQAVDVGLLVIAEQVVPEGHPVLRVAMPI